MTDKKTIRDGAAVTENEAVERLVAAFRREMEVDGSLSWDKAARIALVSHPAVEVLDRLSTTCRDYIDYRDTQVAGELYRAIMERTEEARTVLASLPKEK